MAQSNDITGNLSKGEDIEEFRDHIATIDKDGKRVWIYPKRPSGPFYNARTWVSFAFLVLFLGIPFIKINDEPLMLFNIIERKFIILGVLFTTQDFVLLGMVMITFLVFIILFTIVYGRLFCGWVCPQTVFMEMFFRKIEYWIEGDYTRQRKLDNEPWSMDKAKKKILKHVIFFLIAIVAANFFLAYLIGMDQVLAIITEPVSKHMGGFLAMLLFSAIFYMVFSRLREQVCTTICPYGRMQGVLLVKETIVVIYDWIRGEPRGKLKKATQPEPTPSLKTQGDCIDCKLCIAVCPTGIDIRNGTQLECTNCTACIDACDEVMIKIDKPKGLIRYDSTSGIQTQNRKIFTTRVKAYTAVLIGLIMVDAYFLLNRSPIEAIILRSPGQLYQEVDSTHISNLYTYQLVNKTAHEMPVKLQLNTAGGTMQFVAEEPTMAKKDTVVQGAFFVKMETSSIKSRKTPLEFTILSNGKVVATVKTNFMGPK